MMYEYQGKNTLSQTAKYPVIQRRLLNNNPYEIEQRICEAQSRIQIFNGYDGHYHVFELSGISDDTIKQRAYEYAMELVKLTDESSDTYALMTSKELIRFMLQSPDIALNPTDIPRPGSFRKNIRTQVSVNSDQARCHTVSWEYIRDYVIQIYNNTIIGICKGNEKAQEIFFAEMSKLWFGVTGSVTLSDAYSKLLLSFIKVPELQNKKRIARKIAVELHNQIGNLRAGDSKTNSSIQSELDLPLDAVRLQTLPPGTLYIDEWRYHQSNFSTFKTLEQPQLFIIITDDTIIKRLIALLELNAAGEISIFTTQNTIQSSDHAGMNDSESLPPGLPVAFPIANGKGYYFFTGI